MHLTSPTLSEGLAVYYWVFFDLFKGDIMKIFQPTDNELTIHSYKKYGNPDNLGWGPKRRLKFNHFLAGDIYECYLNNLVTPETKWLDVGGGRAILPHNKPLSRELADRSKLLISVDPSENVINNPYCDEYSVSLIENYKTD